MTGGRTAWRNRAGTCPPGRCLGSASPETAAKTSAQPEARQHKITRSMIVEVGTLPRSLIVTRLGTVIKLVPEQAWEIAIDHRGEVRERGADGACRSIDCGHRTCCIGETHVTELETGISDIAGSGPTARVPCE